ncbi:S41 family peptidase [Solihabitans fulvus]|uniref:S41 family peptidase n=1 Tax=Solihabitans fulvus TaxID=1892852 RepID=A0A5B2WTJ2_9PSEU|nr:S41 family peptidase [Solihabitans fulvus]KAA2253856.1 S41 family peptidase [Solihabitans fulvus]
MDTERDWSPEIGVLVGQLTDRYVFPDVAERICQVLTRRLAEGAYRGVSDDEGFARVVTEDLQSVNGDKHLRLLHSVAEIPEQDAPELHDMAAQRREAALAGHGFARVERLPGNVALLDVRRLFSPSVSGPAAVAAMNLVADADVLLVDLRRNSGGDPDMVALLCSYLFDEETHLNDLYFRPSDSTKQFWTLPYVPGARFGGDKPVYVVTSSSTFSGGEELSYNLRELGRATLVGEVTRGGAHPGGRYRVAAHLKSAVPSGRAINPVSGTNWEAVGVRPHVEVPAERALDTAYGLALRDVLGLGAEGERRVVAEEARLALKELG